MRDSMLPLAIAAALLSAQPARADFQSCLASLRGEAPSRGVSPATFDQATRGLEPSDAASFLDKQPEFKTAIWDYIAGAVDDERVADGRARMREQASALRAAEQRFGVDPSVLVAIWGVETDFGRNLGKRPLVQSLATLSCEGRRQAFFRGELFATLKIIEHGDIAQDQLIGSWAGAFGQTQFMPSTYQRLAVDLEGNGRRDVVGSVPDALGSSANLLKHAGWVSGLHWGYEVEVPLGYSGEVGRTRKHPAAYWSAQGLRRADGKPLPEGSYGLYLAAGRNGPAFLTTRNFDAIYGYNAAESYVLAVAYLSDRIRGGGTFKTPWPTDDPGVGRPERKEIQSLLNQRGYAVGDPDGNVGDKTRAAIVAYQARAGLPQDGRAATRVLNALRSGR